MVAIPQTYNHGVRRIINDAGKRPIATLNSTVIGIIGTAPDADADMFPVNTPAAILGSDTAVAALGGTGTLPAALDSIFKVQPCRVVVIRVEEGADDAGTITNVIGGIDGATMQRTGMYALLNSNARLGLWPRILIAPGFSHELAVFTEMLIIADRLRGWPIPDAPDTNSVAAVAYRQNFSDKRAFGPCYPHFIVRGSDGSDEMRWASAFKAAALVKQHYEKNFAWAASNMVIDGVIGTTADIDYVNGDPSCEANYLNENAVTTIIRDGGFRIWGVRTCATGHDERWRFENGVVVDDIIGDSIVAAARRLVDHNITKTFFEELVDMTNDYLSQKVTEEVIIGGKAWATGELNSPANLALGKAFIHYDLQWATPAEDINLISNVNPEYFTSLFE